MVMGWPSITLDTGGSAVIPRVCPNCMERADMEWRVGYKMPLSSTRYFQTIYYCKACCDVIKHAGRAQLLQYLIGFGLGIVLLIVMASQFGGKGSGGAWWLLVPPVVAVGAAIGFGVMRRSGKPLGPKMLGRDFAAYHTGTSGFLGVGGKSVYKARRPEWLELLVEANRPKDKPGEKPF